MDETITIKGLDNFDEIEIKKIKEITSAGNEKIQREVKGFLVIMAKKHMKDGDRAKYTFQGKIDSPTAIINVSSTDWDLEKALHKLINKIQASAQNKFRK